MAYLEAVEQDTALVSLNYLYFLERQIEADDERLLAKDLALIAAEEEAKRLQEHIRQSVTAQIENVEPTQRHETGSEMKWKKRFCWLCSVLIVAVWLIGSLIVKPHWLEIAKWFR